LTLGKPFSSGLTSQVQGDPEFFQPFFIRFPRLTLPGSSTVSPSLTSDDVVKKGNTEIGGGKK
jgi:hypothetical protein